jgi:hypothetical protein
VTIETEPILAGLRRMIAEEMHLLSQELDDSLDGSQAARLDHLSRALDEVADMMNQHRAARGD